MGLTDGTVGHNRIIRRQRLDFIQAAFNNAHMTLAEYVKE